MSVVHTSVIKEFRLTPEKIQSQFHFYELQYGQTSRETILKRAPTLAQEIYTAGRGKILSLLQHRPTKRYVIMLRAKDTFEMSDPDLAIRSMNGDSFPDNWIVSSLLERALPRILNDGDRKWFEANGLFYVSNTKELKTIPGMEIITIQASTTPTIGFIGKHLALKTKSFTPLHSHKKEDGKFWRSADKQPRYSLNLSTMSVSKDNDGDYVMLPRFSKHRNKTSALEIIPDNQEAFLQSRAGVMATFLEDFRLAYHGLASIEMLTLDVDQIKVSASRIKDSYNKLHSHLREQPIFIVNKSSVPEAAIWLSESITSLGYSVVSSQEVIKDGLNILIVDNAEEYENNPSQDPYKQAHINFPGTAIQSCTPERLHGKSSSHVVEVLLKELFIKQEVVNRSLMFDYPALPKDAVFIEPVRPEGNLTPDQDWPWACAQINACSINFWWADKALKEEVQLSLDKKQTRSLLWGFSRASAVYWPNSGEIFMITDTEAVTMPDHGKVMKYLNEMNDTHQSSIPTGLLQNYIDSNPDLSQTLSEKITNAISLGVNGKITAEALNSVKYRRKDERHFHDYLSANGYRLKAPFREKGGTMEGMTGIWIDYEHNLYFAGPKGGPQLRQSNFGRIYHLDTNRKRIPEWFRESLEVFHIRHRNPTVQPFIFKHLREFAVTNSPSDEVDSILAATLSQAHS